MVTSVKKRPSKAKKSRRIRVTMRSCMTKMRNNGDLNLDSEAQDTLEQILKRSKSLRAVVSHINDTKYWKFYHTGMINIINAYRNEIIIKARKRREIG